MLDTTSRYLELQVAADDLVTTVRDLVLGGDVSRLRIGGADGGPDLESELGPAVVMAAAAAGAPVCPALVAVRAAAARRSTPVTIGVERRTGSSRSTCPTHH